MSPIRAASTAALSDASLQGCATAVGNGANAFACSSRCLYFSCSPFVCEPRVSCFSEVVIAILLSSPSHIIRPDPFGASCGSNNSDSCCANKMPTELQCHNCKLLSAKEPRWGLAEDSLPCALNRKF